MYSALGIIFYSADSWNFATTCAGNNMILGVDNSLSSPADNRKNNF